MGILQAQNVHYIYQSKYQKVHAVKGINFDFEDGKFYAIVGKSGCGKTTFLSLLAGLDLPTEGQILYDGKSTAERNRDDYRLKAISLICQSYNLFPLLTAEENAAYPLRLRGEGTGKAIAAARSKLSSVGLTEGQFRRFPSQLSGGEQQRVAIARALTAGSELVLADEPTGNLDETNAAAIVDILARLAHEEKRCVIVVTHDPAVAQHADEVLRMSDGCLQLT